MSDLVGRIAEGFDPGKHPRGEGGKFTKVKAGHYATADGKWAIIADAPGFNLGADGAQIKGKADWQLVHDPNGNLRTDHNAGTTLDVLDTLTAAKKVAGTKIAQKAAPSVVETQTKQLRNIFHGESYAKVESMKYGSNDALRVEIDLGDDGVEEYVVVPHEKGVRVDDDQGRTHEFLNAAAAAVHIRRNVPKPGNPHASQHARGRAMRAHNDRLHRGGM